MSIRTSSALVVMLMFLVTAVVAQQAAAPAGSADHVAAIKQSLQQSAAALRQYRWVETTVVSIKGEEKSRAQKSCYYGADGQVQKTPIGDEPEGESKKPRGVRGKIADNKKEDITESMHEAMALVKQYVPPDPARIQAAKDAGRLTVVPPEPQGGVQVKITDYLKAGDSLALALNAATNLLTAVTVSSYTDSAKQAVVLQVSFATLADGTLYPASVHLDVAAEDLAVVISNSGYEKLGG
jgi:hypothetical protein